MNRFHFHNDLLRKDHTLRGGILWGIDGYAIELQGRATSVLNTPRPVVSCCTVTGMARTPVREALERIGGAFSKLGIPHSPVEILINLAPATVEKDGSWLDLPLAVLKSQLLGVVASRLGSHTAVPMSHRGRIAIDITSGRSSEEV